MTIRSTHTACALLYSVYISRWVSNVKRQGQTDRQFGHSTFFEKWGGEGEAHHGRESVWVSSRSPFPPPPPFKVELCSLFRTREGQVLDLWAICPSSWPFRPCRANLGGKCCFSKQVRFQRELGQVVLNSTWAYWQRQPALWKCTLLINEIPHALFCIKHYFSTKVGRKQLYTCSAPPSNLQPQAHKSPGAGNVKDDPTY